MVPHDYRMADSESLDVVQQMLGTCVVVGLGAFINEDSAANLLPTS
jgi:hypothetical protein